MGIFLAIDLKSFYASVECIEKGYDPLDTNLVAVSYTHLDVYKRQELECVRGSWNSMCSGEMRRYMEEHQWRRRRSGA